MGQENPRKMPGDPLWESHQARMRLLSEGELPPGLLRDEIGASWQRSYEHGINCLDTQQTGLKPEQDLQLLLECNRMLIDGATPEFEYLVSQLRNTGLVVLADANANILAMDGKLEFLNDVSRLDMQPGRCWSESLRGTNALGTAVVEGRPVLVNCGEHYMDSLSRVACTSVPIKDTQGQVVGVLDVTRDGVINQPQDNLAMLLLAASNIEDRLFANSYPEQLVLAFHAHPQYLGSSWRGLLALSMDGEVLAANMRACDLLKVSRTELVGLRSSDLLGSHSAQLIARLLQGGISSVQTAKGELFFRAMQVPRHSRLSSSFSQTRPAQAKPKLLAELAGDDSRLARSLYMAHRGLAGDLPVLLLGETGTGKEVVARALHQASDRAEKPFVAVNCAAIPEGLIESELFGYREGAFTGSRKGGMIGRLMQAHTGTLFLDEIGDMPLSLQARLLRVLQERKVAPLGAGDEQKIDVAVICATHCDLKRMVQEQQFREDLYYRVNGISLRLPALREREDLPNLITIMLASLGAATVMLDKDLLELFSSYGWPGNMRQLEMILRSSLAMREDGEQILGLQHLTESLLDELTNACRHSSSIRDNELELIRNALERHHGNVSAAAGGLGISRATLYRKLKQTRG